MENDICPSTITARELALRSVNQPGPLGGNANLILRNDAAPKEQWTAYPPCWRVFCCHFAETGNRKIMTESLADKLSNEISSQRSIKKVSWDPEYVLNPAIEMFEKCTGLSHFDARTATYWTLATHAADELQIFPLLCVFGPAGTGKTTTLELIRNLSKNAGEQLLDGTEMTKAVIREDLNQITTAVIDEADGISEQQILKRYSRTSSKMKVNEPQEDGGWLRVSKNLFGPAVLHRRMPFADPAVQSRSITIRTRPKGSVEIGPYSTKLISTALSFEGGANTIDWSNVERGTSRLDDTWGPLLYVASLIDDQRWLDYAREQIESAKLTLAAGQGQEPTELVLSALIGCVERIGSQIPERVLLSNIREHVMDEGRRINSWQIGELIRTLGFETKTRGGQVWVILTGKEQIKAAADRLGIEDEWLQDTAMIQ